MGQDEDTRLTTRNLAEETATTTLHVGCLRAAIFEVPSRNRKRILKAVSWCPKATWQLRVGSYRVLYEVERGVVTLLRVTFKGTQTTEEMGQ